MTEETKSITIEVPAPQFLNFLEEKTREEVIAEVKKQLSGEVKKMVEFTAQKIVTHKLSLNPPQKEPPKKITY